MAIAIAVICDCASCWRSLNGFSPKSPERMEIQSGVTVRFLVLAKKAPHLRAILAFIMMSIHHSRATLPLEMEDIPHLLTIYQRSNNHNRVTFLTAGVQ